MRRLPYLLFDVFTDTPYEGNPLAVFPDAGDLDDVAMQRIARELNLSESVFLTRGEGAYAASLRIFTPVQEMLFAGHPTVGASIAMTGALGWIPTTVDAFVLREGIGDVPIRIERGDGPPLAWLRTPPIAFGPPLPRDAAARAVGLTEAELHPAFEPRNIGAGNPFFFVALRDPKAVDRARLVETAMREIVDFDEANGLFVFAPVERGAYSRMFAPMSGIVEDPATGSATGPLGAYMVRAGILPLVDGTAFASEQGVAMGRRSILHGRLEVRDGALRTVEIGGNAVLVGEGTLVL